MPKLSSSIEQTQSAPDLAARHADWRPWYREPWPWVLIALPALTIIACGITLWLAISRPDYLVLEPEELQRIKTELRAQQETASSAKEQGNGTLDGDL